MEAVLTKINAGTGADKLEIGTTGMESTQADPAGTLRSGDTLTIDMAPDPNTVASTTAIIQHAQLMHLKNSFLLPIGRVTGITKRDPDRELRMVDTRPGVSPMSLLNCHEYGLDVSTSAEKCPNPGAREKSEAGNFKANTDMGYSLLGILLCLAIVFSTLYR